MVIRVKPGKSPPGPKAALLDAYRECAQSLLTGDRDEVTALAGFLSRAAAVLDVPPAVVRAVLVKLLADHDAAMEGRPCP